MDATMSAGGVRYYPPAPGWVLIERAVAAVNKRRMTIRRYHVLTTMLAPADPLVRPHRWFWLNEVGVSVEEHRRNLAGRIERLLSAPAKIQKRALLEAVS